MTIDQQGLSGKPPAALAALIVCRSRQCSGRRIKRLTSSAEQAVGEISARVAVARLNGGLKEVNAEYKRYRQAQMEKGEPAVPYAKFLERFTASIVRDVAASGRMGVISCLPQR